MTYEKWLLKATQSPLLAQVLKDWSVERVALQAILERQKAQLDAVRALVER